MSPNKIVPLKHVIDELGLRVLYAPDSYDNTEIVTSEINRPALQLAGFFDAYDSTRIQIVGMVETIYLRGLDHEERSRSIDRLFAAGLPLLVVTRSIEPFPEMVEAARKYGVTLAQSSATTSEFTAALISYLNVEMAPYINQHGVLVEVYGEGVLLLGNSGVGKSETAIELVKRGHRLIADDSVEIKRVSSKTLVGTAPEIIRHYIELRGIGIVDVRRLFGMGSVKLTEKIDLVVHLEPWSEDVVYDRMGMETEYTSILGINVPSVTIPVKPGRNLAIIVEVAAMNNRQKKLGYNAAAELDAKITSGSREAQMLSEMNEV
ncbi:MAG: HPr(Ser) kinase/phosphatase [Clostridia bacterium]|nr:HPr(Ser) kinase/phosphatase [Clostridia bacterium]